jgi:AcrR family transcriptional regulator
MADHDPTCERVLDAAGEIFAEKGFKAAAVRDITDRAGVNVSAVNYYFRSKEQLYVETVRAAYEGIAAAVPLPQLPPDLSPADKLRAFIRGFLTRMLCQDGPAWHKNLLMREVGDPTEACAQIVREFVRPMFDALNGILVALLPPEVPVEKRHLIAASIIGQCLHYHHGRHVLRHLVGEEERALHTVDYLTDHIWEFSLAAIRKLYPTRTKGART